MHHVPLTLQCIYGCSDDRDGKKGSEIPGRGEKVEVTWPPLCADDLVQCGELEVDPVEEFVEVCKRRG